MRSRYARIMERDDDNASLLRACRAGDQSAWERLVRRYQRLIYTVPRRAGLSDDGADEVFQRVCVALYQNINRIEQPRLLASWLVTTARRESWRQLKLERGAASLNNDVALADEQGLLADPEELPDELIERVERQHEVREALGELEDRCRTLLIALFYRAEPPSYGEVAAALGLAEGSIGPTRARCLRRLQQILREREG